MAKVGERKLHQRPNRADQRVMRSGALAIDEAGQAVPGKGTFDIVFVVGDVARQDQDVTQAKSFAHPGLDLSSGRVRLIPRGAGLDEHDIARAFDLAGTR